MAVSKYSEKPVVVDAVKYDGTNVAEIATFCPYAKYENGVMKLHGMTVVQPDMWVLKDAAGAFTAYPSNFLDYYKPGGGP